MTHITESHLSVSLELFEEFESNVRTYCRNFPTIFTKAKGHTLWDETGREYIDFFSGAGALNYGHNNASLQQRLVEYIQRDGITHSLDMYTQAKGEFLQRFNTTILQPRDLSYKVMFPGPTGTNAVESALKLARKVTGRPTVISFSNAFHGMTLGSLAVSGNRAKREGAGVPLPYTVHMPYEGYLGQSVDTIAYLKKYIEDSGSGVALPAAIILETVQGEGGVNVASDAWLQQVERLCRQHEILLIVDDVQVGCGRTGPFFSFESAGITPDMICLSKSISGYGLPMALTLIRPEWDQFAPGEHNGTFRGHNLAFVTAHEALNYWQDDTLTQSTLRKGQFVQQLLTHMAEQFPSLEATVRGRGLLQGMAIPDPGLAEKIASHAFSQGLIIETSGADSHVVKILPPLTISQQALEKGLSILAQSIAKAVA